MTMKNIAVVAALGGVALALSACDVDQTKEGKLPEVDVKGGQMPAYDVDTPNVNVSTEERTMEVPTVKVEDQ